MLIYNSKIEIRESSQMLKRAANVNSFVDCKVIPDTWYSLCILHSTWTFMPSSVFTIYPWEKIQSLLVRGEQKFKSELKQHTASYDYKCDRRTWPSRDQYQIMVCQKYPCSATLKQIHHQRRGLMHTVEDRCAKDKCQATLTYEKLRQLQDY
jgi:hypothetical protein